MLRLLDSRGSQGLLVLLFKDPPELLKRDLLDHEDSLELLKLDRPVHQDFRFLVVQDLQELQVPMA